VNTMKKIFLSFLLLIPMAGLFAVAAGAGDLKAGKAKPAPASRAMNWTGQAKARIRPISAGRSNPIWPNSFAATRTANENTRS